MGGVILRVGLISAAVLLAAPVYAGSSEHKAATAPSQSANPAGNSLPDAMPDYGDDGSIVNPDGGDDSANAPDGDGGYGDDQDDGGNDDDALPPTNQI